MPSSDLGRLYPARMLNGRLPASLLRPNQAPDAIQSPEAIEHIAFRSLFDFFSLIEAVPSLAQYPKGESSVKRNTWKEAYLVCRILGSSLVYLTKSVAQHRQSLC